MNLSKLLNSIKERIKLINLTSVKDKLVSVYSMSKDDFKKVYSYLNKPLSHFAKPVPILLATIFVAFCSYGVVIGIQNNNLKNDVNELYSINIQQMKLIESKTAKISDLEQKEAAINDQISALTKKISDMTDTYVLSKTSRGGDRGDSNFSDEMQDIRDLINSLTRIYDQVDKESSDLVATEDKVNQYIQTIPTLWPASGGLGNGFGYRKDPFTGRRAFHEGIDIDANYGYSIKASADGRVVFAATQSGYGRDVIIYHGKGLSTLYAHCSKLLVKEGQIVKKGDIIARVGSTGRSTGPHLHFEVRLYGTPVDPMEYVSR